MSEKNIIIYEDRKIDLSDKIRRVKESLICVICQNLPQHPVRIVKCGHHFCKECIYDHNNCFVCQKKFISSKDLVTDVYTENKINALFTIEDRILEANQPKVSLTEITNHRLPILQTTSNDKTPSKNPTGSIPTSNNSGTKSKRIEAQRKLLGLNKNSNFIEIPETEKDLISSPKCGITVEETEAPQESCSRSPTRKTTKSGTSSPKRKYNGIPIEKTEVPRERRSSTTKTSLLSPTSSPDRKTSKSGGTLAQLKSGEITEKDLISSPKCGITVEETEIPQESRSRSPTRKTTKSGISSPKRKYKGIPIEETEVPRERRSSPTKTSLLSPTSSPDRKTSKSGGIIIEETEIPRGTRSRKTNSPVNSPRTQPSKSACSPRKYSGITIEETEIPLERTSRRTKLITSVMSPDGSPDRKSLKSGGITIEETEILRKLPSKKKKSTVSVIVEETERDSSQITESQSVEVSTSQSDDEIAKAKEEIKLGKNYKTLFGLVDSKDENRDIFTPPKAVQESKTPKRSNSKSKKVNKKANETPKRNTQGRSTSNKQEELNITEVKESKRASVGKVKEKIETPPRRVANNKNVNKKIDVESPKIVQNAAAIETIQDSPDEILSLPLNRVNNVPLPKGYEKTLFPKCVWITSATKYEQISKRNKVGETKLHIAVIKGDIDRVKEHIEKFKDVNFPDHFGWTPLHEAVKHNRIEVAELLLNAGAVVNIPSSSYDTPLHLAAEHRNKQLMELLIKYGGLTEIKNYQGTTPLDHIPSDWRESLLMETDRCKIPPLITESTEIEVISLDKIPIKAMKFSNISFKLTNMNSNSVQKTCVVLVPEIDVFPAANVITLKAILNGFWIVSSKWYINCCQAQEFIDPVGYEVTGTANCPNSNTPMRARLRRQLLAPELFHGCNFYVAGNKYVRDSFVFTRQDIIGLIEAGGGKVLKRRPDPEDLSDLYPYHCQGRLAKCSNYIIYLESPLMPEYRFTQLHTLSAQWLLDSIEAFQLDFKSEIYNN